MYDRGLWRYIRFFENPVDFINSPVYRDGCQFFVIFPENPVGLAGMDFITRNEFITNMNLLQARNNLRITSASESRRYKKLLWRSDYDYLSSAFFYWNLHLTRRTVAFPNALERPQEGGGQKRRGRLTLDLLGAHFGGVVESLVSIHIVYCLIACLLVVRYLCRLCYLLWLRFFVSFYVLSVRILENNDFRRMRISACRHSAVPLIGCC